MQFISNNPFSQYVCETYIFQSVFSRKVSLKYQLSLFHFKFECLSNTDFNYNFYVVQIYPPIEAHTSIVWNLYFIRSEIVSHSHPKRKIWYRNSTVFSVFQNCQLFHSSAKWASKSGRIGEIQITALILSEKCGTRMSQRWSNVIEKLETVSRNFRTILKNLEIKRRIEYILAL